MSDNEGLDIGKVVALIMENPQLIEQIASLAKDKESIEEKAEAPEEKAEAQTTEEMPVLSQAAYTHDAQTRSNRSQLFCALKPYVSSERAKAIDSMLAIADILDMMKAR